jgi:outer membrane lipoprotein
MQKPAVAVAALLLASAGCASTEPGSPASSDTSRISFAQLKAAPDSFRGHAVVFGGEVLAARRMKDSTRIEILQLPQDSGYPVYDLTQSQGRFIAIQKEFLDPATLPRGTRVTVSGEVTGTLTLPLDETEYTYPVIEVTRLHVWSRNDGGPRVQPYYVPGLYGYGPYWGPYWRPWPYW